MALILFIDIQSRPSHYNVHLNYCSDKSPQCSTGQKYVYKVWFLFKHVHAYSCCGVRGTRSRRSRQIHVRSTACAGAVAACGGRARIPSPATPRRGHPALTDALLLYMLCIEIRIVPTQNHQFKPSKARTWTDRHRLLRVSYTKTTKLKLS